MPNIVLNKNIVIGYNQYSYLNDPQVMIESIINMMFKTTLKPRELFALEFKLISLTQIITYHTYLIFITINYSMIL